MCLINPDVIQEVVENTEIATVTGMKAFYKAEIENTEITTMIQA
jgi:hypothetical protein